MFGAKVGIKTSYPASAIGREQYKEAKWFFSFSPHISFFQILNFFIFTVDNFWHNYSSFVQKCEKTFSSLVIIYLKFNLNVNLAKCAAKEKVQGKRGPCFINSTPQLIRTIFNVWNH